ncbi:UNVERIFIED_CONTAM: hypothetical protein NCL1_34336 [Trichonephila clavipes]
MEYYAYVCGMQPKATQSSRAGASKTSFIRTFIIRSFKYSDPFLPLERQSLKNAWNKLWKDFGGKNDFNDNHREEITDFVQSILEFQECDEEDVQT